MNFDHETSEISLSGRARIGQRRAWRAQAGRSPRWDGWDMACAGILGLVAAGAIWAIVALVLA